MPTLVLHGSLLVAWTDPMVVGAAAIGLAVIGVVLALRSRESTASASPGSGQGAAASSQPAQGGDVNPVERAKQAREQAQERAEEPEPDTENLARGGGRTLAELAAHDDVDDTELISRFVVDSSGDRLGETMTVTEGEVILKRDGEFFAVPPDAIIEKSGTLLADGNIDWDRAREAGEAWQDENLDRMEYDETGMPQQG